MTDPIFSATNGVRRPLAKGDGARLTEAPVRDQIRSFCSGFTPSRQAPCWPPVSGTPSPVAGIGQRPSREPRGEPSADLPSANLRANFAGVRASDFRAPDWPRGLRDNPSNEPLAAWAYQVGSGWPPLSGRRAIRGWNSGPPCRSLLPTGSRGGRGKETCALMETST